MVKARAQNKDEKCKYLNQRIYLVDRFVEAREVVKIAYQLLEQPDVESAVRVGDVFALLVEYYHSQGNMQQAYMLIEKMRGRNIILSPYLDSELIEQVYSAMGVEQTAAPAPASAVDEEMDDEIEEDM